MHRHRDTQVVLMMPPMLQRILFPAVIGIGQLLSRYRGAAWPGCPVRCQGAPDGGTREVQAGPTDA
jgi:hypothetical protein